MKTRADIYGQEATELLRLISLYPGLIPVSYTHLDVYKRQVYIHHTRDVSISRMGLTLLCGDDRPVAIFELTLSPCRENSMRRKD